VKPGAVLVSLGRFRHRDFQCVVASHPIRDAALLVCCVPHEQRAKTPASRSGFGDSACVRRCTDEPRSMVQAGPL
jgi:hypothetical protein